MMNAADVEPLPVAPVKIGVSHRRTAATLAEHRAPVIVARVEYERERLGVHESFLACATDAGDES